MAKSTLTATGVSPPDESYWALCHALPLRPIADPASLARALAVTDELLDRINLTAGEQDYLAVLGELIHAYEELHEPAAAPADPAGMLAFLLEQHAVDQSRLALATGIPEPTLSAILSGQLDPGRPTLRILGKYFHVDPRVFF